MAYTSTSQGNEKPVRYLDKDFGDFKNALINMAEIYYPDLLNDFTEGSPGTMFIEMASYIGDVLSFYTDTQIQEVFLQYAQERENLYALAYNLGYIPTVTTPALVNLDLFQQIPAKSNGLPDYDYALKIEKNSDFLPNNGLNTRYLLQSDVNFSFSSSVDPTEQTVYSLNGTQPEYFLLKKTAKALSAELKTSTFGIGAAERFKTISLDDSNIIGIQSIVDSEGNSWTEVPYLAQETIFEEVPNNEAYDPELPQYSGQVPYLLRTKKVSKRFITRFKSNQQLEIHFGAGSTGGDDTSIIPNPDNIGLGIKDGRSLLDKAYDPSNFLYTKAYGEAPANTTLTVTYMVGGGLKANAPSNTINRVGNVVVSPRVGGLNSTLLTDAKNSLQCNNPNPALGGGPGDSPQDIRLNTVAQFATQKRTVTKEDYIFRTLSMPSQLGNIAKAYITQDNQISLETSKRIANPNALNLYVLGFNLNKQLEILPEAAKINLATYIEQYRMLTDAINIKDASILNFQVEFNISVKPGFNNEQTLLSCINTLKRFFSIDNLQINQPIIEGDVSSILYGIEGVQNVTKLEFVNKFGGIYSQFKYNFVAAKRNGIIYPPVDPSIFELKYPNNDLIGRVNR